MMLSIPHSRPKERMRMKIRELIEAAKAIPDQLRANTLLAISAFFMAAIALALVLIGGVRNAN